MTTILLMIIAVILVTIAFRAVMHMEQAPEQPVDTTSEEEVNIWIDHINKYRN